MSPFHLFPLTRAPRTLDLERGFQENSSGYQRGIKSGIPQGTQTHLNLWDQAGDI